jgi:CBS domain-containing protein
MKVADLMTKNVICVRVNEPLSVAAEQMWKHDCGALPVLDQAGERLIGMVTDRDICMTAWKSHKALQNISVSDATSRMIYFCTPDDSIASAEALMREKQVRRLPVIDRDGRCVGILALADIARETDRERSRRDKEIVPDELAATLAAICNPPQNTTVPVRAA